MSLLIPNYILECRKQMRDKSEQIILAKRNNLQDENALSFHIDILVCLMNYRSHDGGPILSYNVYCTRPYQVREAGSVKIESSFVHPFSKLDLAVQSGSLVYAVGGYIDDTPDNRQLLECISRYNDPKNDISEILLKLMLGSTTNI